MLKLQLLIIGVALFVVMFSVVPAVFANGEHAPGEEHDGITGTGGGVRWPVIIGGLIAILVVVVFTLKFIVK